ncbi:uncharacterized protein EI90DRAFT_2530748 [Cantharellus anzutake]|uniref:uncharacterized protein n=1 Tax=Cantharellus anzutake TaxID=1750568 RepID=UPI001902DCBC|nr:uncharacterized protein EI90DRAFT_2530748 [Cantharellus anzutake]KAF8338011.1 hypothetical protein EI90DRAFT_2530748 [Cantharellus anzutake]
MTGSKFVTTDVNILDGHAFVQDILEIGSCDLGNRCESSDTCACIVQKPLGRFFKDGSMKCRATCSETDHFFELHGYLAVPGSKQVSILFSVLFVHVIGEAVIPTAHWPGQHRVLLFHFFSIFWNMELSIERTRACSTLGSQSQLFVDYHELASPSRASRSPLLGWKTFWRDYAGRSNPTALLDPPPRCSKPTGLAD